MRGPRNRGLFSSISIRVCDMTDKPIEDQTHRVKSHVERAVDALLRPATRAEVYALFVAFILCAGVASFAISAVTKHQHRDESHTHSIQVVGLHASHCLANLIAGVEPVFVKTPALAYYAREYSMLEIQQPGNCKVPSASHKR